MKPVPASSQSGSAALVTAHAAERFRTDGRDGLSVGLLVGAWFGESLGGIRPNL